MWAEAGSERSGYDNTAAILDGEESIESQEEEKHLDSDSLVISAEMHGED